MSDKTDNKKKALLEALEKCLGIVTDACKNTNISRDTHYRWLKEDEKYKEAVEELEGVALDFAESKLHQKISTGDTTAIIFFLKTKGKKRGYIERQEIDQRVTNIETKLIRPDGTEWTVENNEDI